MQYAPRVASRRRKSSLLDNIQRFGNIIFAFYKKRKNLRFLFLAKKQKNCAILIKMVEKYWENCRLRIGRRMLYNKNVMIGLRNIPDTLFM